MGKPEPQGPPGQPQEHLQETQGFKDQDLKTPEVDSVVLSWKDVNISVSQKKKKIALLRLQISHKGTGRAPVYQSTHYCRVISGDFHFHYPFLPRLSF